ncbi:hypothetical protein PMIN06_007499 [Paraphaeosphaeria minitans]
MQQRWFFASSTSEFVAAARAQSPEGGSQAIAVGVARPPSRGVTRLPQQANAQSPARTRAHIRRGRGKRAKKKRKSTRKRKRKRKKKKRPKRPTRSQQRAGTAGSSHAVLPEIPYEQLPALMCWHCISGDQGWPSSTPAHRPMTRPRHALLPGDASR